MSDYVAKYTCGSCSNYEYEGQNTKGYCSYYKCYYYPDDSCNHWEESSSYSSGSSGCFITSACVEYKGMKDNCLQLETMRAFRDNYIMNQAYGMDLCKDYYNQAPAIVEYINNSPKKDDIYEDIYDQLMKIVGLIEEHRDDEAIIYYMWMFHRLCEMTYNH